MILDALLGVFVLGIQGAEVEPVPLPPLDSTYGLPTPVLVEMESPPAEASVRIRLDEWGRVRDIEIEIPSDLMEIDRHNVETAARRLRFLPAEDRDPGWIPLTVPLKARGSGRDRGWAPDAGPEFTPFEKRPELKSPAGARRAVERAYPEPLRRAGYGGTVILWAFVDSTGEVRNVKVNRSSGHPLLDEAAESVLWDLEFHPATNKGWKVPVWIQQSISFTVKSGRGDFPKEYRRPERLTLGSSSHPVAEATTTSPYFYHENQSPEDRPEPPELILPDSIEATLNRLFLNAGGPSDLGVDVELTVDVEGLVRDVRLAAILPEGTSDSALAYRVVDAVRELRLRPTLVSGMRKPLPLTVRFVFVPGLGLAPSAIGGCDADSALRSRPQLNLVEKAAEIVTPDWERARVIAQTWPLSLQRRGRRYDYRFWVLVDTRGRVCDVEPIGRVDRRWEWETARQIVHRLRYSPARRDGEAVPAWRQDAVRFSF